MRLFIFIIPFLIYGTTAQAISISDAYDSCAGSLKKAFPEIKCAKKAVEAATSFDFGPECLSQGFYDLHEKLETITYNKHPALRKFTSVFFETGIEALKYCREQLKVEALKQ